MEDCTCSSDWRWTAHSAQGQQQCSCGAPTARLTAQQSVYQALTGPLARIPGPLLNKITVLPLRLATVTGRRAMYIEQLVRQYGEQTRTSSCYGPETD